MRILIIAEVYLPKVDGVVYRTMTLIRHLQSRGDEVLVICPSAHGRVDSPVPMKAFKSFPCPSYPEYRIGVPDAELGEAVDSFQPDIIHFLNPFAFGFQCHDWLISRRERRPLLFSFHTLYSEFVKQYAGMAPMSRMLWWLTRSYHNQADCNLTVSSIMRDELAAAGFDRVELWPPAVDCELFSPHRRDASMRERLTDGHPAERVLLTVSRLAPEKNVGFLAEWMRRLPADGRSGVRLAIVGDGPQRADLERQFSGSRTRFLGYLRGAELAAAYASADAFVYASETETMGNVILEAMAAGLVVVAPRAGGIPSLVRDGVDGLLYTPRDPDDAARVLAPLLSDDAYRARLATGARAAVEPWGWDRSVERVREHYEQTIARFHADGPAADGRNRLASVVVRALVNLIRAASFVTRPRVRGKETPAVSPARPGEPILSSHRGLHGHRPESSGT
ncbi:MAG: glycosyltransferase family 4 protein [Planctomycetota bacterium]